MATLLQSGSIEFVDRVSVPGQNWSIGVPKGFAFSTDPKVNGKSSASASGVYDLIVVKPKSKERPSFDRPYGNAISFVTLEIETAEMYQRAVSLLQDVEEIVRKGDLKITACLFSSVAGIDTYQVFVHTDGVIRRCQILISGPYKKEEKKEFVRLWLESVECNEASAAAPVKKTEKKAKKGDRDELVPLNDTIAQSQSDPKAFTVNGEWCFTLPRDLDYKIDAEYAGAIKGGVDVFGSVKPMVIQGLPKGADFLFNFYLQPHRNVFGQYGTVLDCKYDNRVVNGDKSVSQVIVTDEDDLYVDLISENAFPFGYLLSVRVRGASIAPFDFYSEAGSLTEEEFREIAGRMAEIAKSIRLKNAPKAAAKKPAAAPKAETKPIDPNYIVEKGVLLKYIGTDPNVVIPEGVTEIADNVFSGRDIESVVIPEGVKVIGERAFENCFPLEKVVLPKSLKEIGGYCFSDCHSLSELELPKGLTYLGSSAFTECYELPEQTIPKGLKVIDSFVFKNCKPFKKVFLPEGVTYIGVLAFAYCENMTDLYVPATVETICDTLLGQTPFDGIPDLTIHTTAGSAMDKYASEHSITVLYDYNPKGISATTPAKKKNSLPKPTYRSNTFVTVGGELKVPVPDGYRYSDQGEGANAHWLYMVPEGVSLAENHIDAKPMSFGVTMITNKHNFNVNEVEVDFLIKKLTMWRALEPTITVDKVIKPDCVTVYQIFHDGEDNLWNKITGHIFYGNVSRQFHIYANHDAKIASDRSTIDTLLEICRDWVEQIQPISAQADKPGDPNEVKETIKDLTRIVKLYSDMIPAPSGIEKDIKQFYLSVGALFCKSNNLPINDDVANLFLSFFDSFDDKDLDTQSMKALLLNDRNDDVEEFIKYDGKYLIHHLVSIDKLGNVEYKDGITVVQYNGIKELLLGLCHENDIAFSQNDFCKECLKELKACIDNKWNSMHTFIAPTEEEETAADTTSNASAVIDSLRSVAPETESETASLRTPYKSATTTGNATAMAKPVETSSKFAPTASVDPASRYQPTAPTQTSTAATAKPKSKKKLIIAAIVVVLLLVAIIVPVSIVKKINQEKEDAPYKELQAALNDGTYSAEWRTSDGYRLVSTSDQRAMQIVADKVTEYHQNDDVDSALALITILCELKVDIDGKYFYASTSFIKWVKTHAETEGELTKHDKSDYYYHLNGYDLKWNPNMMMEQFRIFVETRSEWVIVTVNNGFYNIPTSNKASIN